MSDPLAKLARRLENDPRFLGSVLAEYARSEGLDDDGLARALGCRPEALTELRLCRAPRPEPAGFREDVGHLAGRFGLDAARLTKVLRRADALRRLRDGAAGLAGFHMAARDRPEGPPSPAGDAP